MFQKFTEAAIKTIMLAQEESRRLGHKYVSTDQILLGLLGIGSGPVAKTLDACGIQLKEARVEVEKTRGRGTGPLTVELPFTDEAKRTLEKSWDIAEHLLLAIVRKKDCDAHNILEALGANLETLEVQIKNHCG